MSRGFAPRALGEVAIRCREIGPMLAFYRDVIGLTVLSGAGDDDIVFLHIAEGFQGHMTVLALFRHDAIGRTGRGAERGMPPVSGRASSLHHLALSLPYAEQEAVIAWYEELGRPYRVERFDWIGWRGVFTEDPEGNTVELVAKDPDWQG